MCLGGVLQGLESQFSFISWPQSCFECISVPLAASYLALALARRQGMNLSPTPAHKQTKYSGKEEV